MKEVKTQRMRVYHRYLGFFLAGIMAMYSISGITLIFRDTDFLKIETRNEKSLEPNLTVEELGRALRMRDLKIQSENGDIITFPQGTYNKSTGIANYSTKELPYLLDKMTKLHKAEFKDPLFFLNVFFGLSLLFFVVSAFWMFSPNTTIFKKGLYFTLIGAILTLILILI